MDEREQAHRRDEARTRDEEDRERFAARRAERQLTREEDALERGLKALDEDEKRAERDIEAEWRSEHWGHDPDRPPAWRKQRPEDVDADRRRPRGS